MGSSPYLTPDRLADVSRRTVPPLTLSMPNRLQPPQQQQLQQPGGRGQGDDGGGEEEEEEDGGLGIGLPGAEERRPRKQQRLRSGGAAAADVATDASVPPVFSMARR